jgi:hypothetical protein
MLDPHHPIHHRLVRFKVSLATFLGNLTNGFGLVLGLLSNPHELDLCRWHGGGEGDMRLHD